MEDEAQRTSCDYVLPPDCSGEQLDDRVLFLHGGVYIYYSCAPPLSTAVCAG